MGFDGAEDGHARKGIAEEIAAPVPQKDGGRVEIVPQKPEHGPPENGEIKAGQGVPLDDEKQHHHRTGEKKLPWMLSNTASQGVASISGTCLWAAACNTTSGRWAFMIFDLTNRENLCIVLDNFNKVLKYW